MWASDRCPNLCRHALELHHLSHLLWPYESVTVSKTVGDTSFKFYTQVGSDDDVQFLNNVVWRINNNNAFSQYIIKGTYNRIPVVDITVKLCQSTNPTTAMFIPKLHVCKQQHTHSWLKCLFHVSLISNTLIGMYLKFHKHLGFDGPKCTHVLKLL